MAIGLKTLFNIVLSHSQGASSSIIYVALVKHSFWYLDLACCNHIAPDSTSCTIQTHTFHMPINHITSGSTMTVIGIVSTTQLSISNVCLMPKFSWNFLYVGQLCELGLRIRFSSIGCVVQNPQMAYRPLGQNFKLDGFFFLHLHT